MKEAYVKFETAKLLKEKGFNIPSDTSYEDYLWQMYDENGKVHWGIYSSDWYFRITQQMACRWLREVKGTTIVIEVGWMVYNNEPYYYALYARLDDPDKVFQIKGDFADYQDCVEAAIKFILKNVIK